MPKIEDMRSSIGSEKGFKHRRKNYSIASKQDFTKLED